MRITLLKDFEQDGKVKVTVSKKRRIAIPWFEGATIDVSDETGKKFIKDGIARVATKDEMPDVSKAKKPDPSAKPTGVLSNASQKG